MLSKSGLKKQNHRTYAKNIIHIEHMSPKYFKRSKKNVLEQIAPMESIWTKMCFILHETNDWHMTFRLQRIIPAFL